MDPLWLLFYAPMVLVQAHPAASFAIAASLIGLQAGLTLMAGAPLGLNWFRHPAVLGGLLWVIYGLYELQVQATTPGANIRIDLLVLTPILYVFSLLALWSLVVQLLALGKRSP